MPTACAQLIVGMAGGKERRYQAEQQTGAERQEQREADDRQIERHLIQARHRDAVRDQDEQSAMERDGQGEAGQSSRRTEQQAFRQHHPQQPPALGPKRGAQAQLALASRAPRKQEIGHVDAGDQQHQAHRAGEDQQRRADLLHGQLVNRHHAHRPGGVALRHFRFELRGNRLHLVGGLLHRHTVAQPRHRMRRAAARRRAQPLQRPAVRHQEIGPLALDRESRRHHADDRARARVGGERHAQHVRPSAEPRLPEFVADHDDAVVALEVLVR